MSKRLVKLTCLLPGIVATLSLVILDSSVWDVNLCLVQTL